MLILYVALNLHAKLLNMYTAIYCSRSTFEKDKDKTSARGVVDTPGLKQFPQDG